MTEGNKLGTYYLEKGIGLRPSNIIYDRKYSPFSLMINIEWKLSELFKDVTLFHITGITPALSPIWQKILMKLIKEAKKQSITVGLDINYRSKLWSIEACRTLITEVALYVDYCSAAKLDALNFFQIVEKENATLVYCYGKIQEMYSNIQVFF